MHFVLYLGTVNRLSFNRLKFNRLIARRMQRLEHKYKSTQHSLQRYTPTHAHVHVTHELEHPLCLQSKDSIPQ